MNLPIRTALNELLVGELRPSAAVTLFSLLQAASVVPVALVIQQILDRSLPTQNFYELLGLGALAVLLINVAAVFGLMGRTIALNTTKHHIAALRRRLVNSVLSWPREQITTHSIGALHDTLVHDTERIDLMVNAILVIIIPAIVICTGLFGVLLYISPVLCGMVVCVAPLGWLLVRKLNRRVKLLTAEWHHEFSSFSGKVLRLIRGWDIVKTTATDVYEETSQATQIENTRAAGLAVSRAQNNYAQAHQAFFSSLGVLILVFGGYLIMKNSLTIGSLLSFYAALGVARVNLVSALNQIPIVIAGIDAWSHVERLLAQSEPPAEPGIVIDSPRKLSLRNVAFGYDTREILRDVSLTVHRGELIGICGMNGSGKTTILNLLSGFYPPARGEVLLNESSFQSIDSLSLRRHIGYVQQNPIFFCDTIRENLLLGDTTISELLLHKTLTVCGCSEFIKAMPLGLTTVIGDEGVLLSGGQKQRLAIARALLRSPAFLLLDEPTTFLDSNYVREIIPALRAALPTVGIIMVSHDEQILSAADEIFVLESGRLYPRRDRERQLVSQ